MSFEDKRTQQRVNQHKPDECTLGDYIRTESDVYGRGECGGTVAPTAVA